MHGVAPHFAVKGARPLQGREAGGRSPGFILFLHVAGTDRHKRESELFDEHESRPAGGDVNTNQSGRGRSVRCLTALAVHRAPPRQRRPTFLTTRVRASSAFNALSSGDRRRGHQAPQSPQTPVSLGTQTILEMHLTPAEHSA
jgi:hypothetical protein